MLAGDKEIVKFITEKVENSVTLKDTCEGQDCGAFTVSTKSQILHKIYSLSTPACSVQVKEMDLEDRKTSSI